MSSVVNGLHQHHHSLRRCETHYGQNKCESLLLLSFRGSFVIFQFVRGQPAVSAVRECLANYFPDNQPATIRHLLCTLPHLLQFVSLSFTSSTEYANERNETNSNRNLVRSHETRCSALHIMRYRAVITVDHSAGIVGSAKRAKDMLGLRTHLLYNYVVNRATQHDSN